MQCTAYYSKFIIPFGVTTKQVQVQMTKQTFPKIRQTVDVLDTIMNPDLNTEVLAPELGGIPGEMLPKHVFFCTFWSSFEGELRAALVGNTINTNQR